MGRLQGAGCNTGAKKAGRHELFDRDGEGWGWMEGGHRCILQLFVRDWEDWGRIGEGGGQVHTINCLTEIGKVAEKSMI